MGLFKRLHRITIGRIEAFLDRAEDPEILLPQLLREMEKQLGSVTQVEAKARASLKRAVCEHARQKEKIASLQRGAGNALRAGQEDVARLAVEVEIDAEKMLEVFRENLDRAQDAMDHAIEARKHTQMQLQELRSRREEILTRARVARAQKRIQRTVSGSVGSANSILDAVARLEEGVEEMEAQLEIQVSLVGDYSMEPSLQRRLRELDSAAEVELRMARLRQQILPPRQAEPVMG